MLVGAPSLAIPAIILAAALVLASRLLDQPIATQASDLGRRWHVWLIVAGALFALGFAMLMTNEDGELSSIAWAVWILSWLSAAVLATFGVGLRLTRMLHQRRA